MMKANAIHAENDVPYADPSCANFDRHMIQSYLRQEIEARRGNHQSNNSRFSTRFVIEQSAERYFQLLEMTKHRLKRRIATRDFEYLLNVNCSPVWRHYAQDSLAWDVVDSLGLEVRSLEDIPDSELREFASKLRDFTPVETYAIVDACERVWRGYDNPLV
jgi:hypothetical protein